MKKLEFTSKELDAGLRKAYSEGYKHWYFDEGRLGPYYPSHSRIYVPEKYSEAFTHLWLSNNGGEVFGFIDGECYYKGVQIVFRKGKPREIIMLHN